MDRKWLLFFFCFFILLPFLVRAQDFELPQFPMIPGRVEGKGTHFEIKDSEYLNVSLESSEEIKLIFESIPRMISLTIESSSTSTSTQLTLSGLEPNKTYFKYEDSYKNETVFISDESGSFSWEQDLTQSHHVWIQEIKGTVFIPQDCTSTIGTWDASFSICTLRQDLNESIEIVENNFILNCDHFKIKGNFSGFGIHLNKVSNVEIRNCGIENFSYGIYVENSSNITISENKIISNQNGIYLSKSKECSLSDNKIEENKKYFGLLLLDSNKNEILKNSFSKNFIGVTLQSSSENLLNENLIKDGDFGLRILAGGGITRGNKFFGNLMENNRCNFNFYPDLYSIESEIDKSNLVEGKPIYFLKNVKDLTLDESSNAGTIFCINCENVTIKNLELTKNYFGIVFWNTKNSKIENVNTSGNCVVGILLSGSSYNTIKNVLSNENNYPLWGAGGSGIYLFDAKIEENLYQSSHHNLIVESTFSLNNEAGITIIGSENLISGNTLKFNGRMGIFLLGGGNEVRKNAIESNKKAGVWFLDASSNIIWENNISKNGTGLFINEGFGPSKGNKIYHNNFLQNSTQIFSKNKENFFDNGYPSGGNYWSDYDTPEEDCVDENRDGFCDNPYIFSYGQDNYPFIKENGWALPKVLISEVYYDVAKDKGEEGDNEWVIIHNLENEEFDLSGWKICSKDREERCNELSRKIPANGLAIISPTSTTFNFWKIPNDMTKIILDKKFGSYGLNNDGDNILLKDEEGKIIDAMSYGNDKSIFDPPCQKVKEGNSLLRFPPDADTDTAQDFVESEPTIGKNQPPIPIINFSPKNPVKGIEVKFDASSSTDPDGQIVNFEWYIKNASTSEILATLTTKTMNFVFQENGEYEIVFIATDNDSATSSTSTILEVEPFSFAIITDLHIGRGYSDYDSSGFDDSDGGEDYYLTERLKNVVQWVIDNKNNIQCENATCSIKFLAVLGDIADSAEKSEFLKAKKILDRLNEYGIPYVPVFGNHDVWPYTDEEEATSTLGEDYFKEIFWDENATNTKLMKEILKIERDESNPKYKNFAFSFGGINFIGLDFNSREKSSEGGVKGEGVLHSETIEWLKTKLNEWEGKEAVIVFSHEPFAEPKSRSLYKIKFPREEGNFSDDEMRKIKEILENYEDKSEGKQIFANFGGHIHGFEKFGKEIIGQFSPIDLFFDANYEYPTLSTVPIISTEALMVGGNEKELNNKGVVRIVKIDGKESIDFSEIEAKFPALNPLISFDFKILPDQIYPCLFFKAHIFSHREYSLFWDFGDGNTGSGETETHCYSPLQVPQTYNVKLTAIDKETGKEENITRKIEIKKGIIPKIIRISEEIKEKLELISTELGEKVTEFGRTMRDWVLIKVKHSPSTPVGLINVHFQNANTDIDLTQMIVDIDTEKKKSILYMPQWPEVIENEKILFISK